MMEVIINIKADDNCEVSDGGSEIKITHDHCKDVGKGNGKSLRFHGECDFANSQMLISKVPDPSQDAGGGIFKVVLTTLILMGLIQIGVLVILSRWYHIQRKENPGWFNRFGNDGSSWILPCVNREENDENEAHALQ